VDLITNSSSEVFITPDQKSLDTFKEMVIEIAKEVNATRREEWLKDALKDEKLSFDMSNARVVDIQTLFLDVFSNVYISTIELKSNKITKAYEKNFCGSARWSDNSLKQECDENFHRRLKEKEKKSKKVSTDFNNDLYEECMRPYYEAFNKAYMEFVTEVLRQNDISLEEYGKYVTNKGGEYFEIEPSAPSRVKEVYSYVSLFQLYPIYLKRGSIICDSATDNSVDWTLNRALSEKLGTISIRTS
jgi:hypothetical protein